MEFLGNRLDSRRSNCIAHRIRLAISLVVGVILVPFLGSGCGKFEPEKDSKTGPEGPSKVSDIDGRNGFDGRDLASQEVRAEKLGSLGVAGGSTMCPGRDLIDEFEGKLSEGASGSEFTIFDTYPSFTTEIDRPVTSREFAELAFEKFFDKNKMPEKMRGMLGSLEESPHFYFKCYEKVVIFIEKSGVRVYFHRFE